MKIVYLALVFILGTIFGSFFNVVIYRLPREESILKPPSHCPKCNTPLRWYDLLPIISFLILRGKCRYCNAKISIRYPIIEALTGVTFTMVAYKYAASLIALKYIVFLSLIIITGFIDLFEGIVPDHITLPGIAAGIIFSAFLGRDSFLQAILGSTFMAVTFLAIIFLSRGGMGQGDVTLGAMIGSFLGLKFSIAAFVIAFVIGAVFGIFALIFLKKKGKDAIPFGPYLSIASYIMVFYGYKIIDFYFSLFFIK